MSDKQIVYFFDNPTIGYCKKCNETAIYRTEKRLVCPKCKTAKISVFVYDGTGPYPE